MLFVGIQLPRFGVQLVQCPTCTFSRKECVASFDVTTTANPELHIVKSDTTSSDTVGITYGITESTGFSIQETGT